MSLAHAIVLSLLQGAFELFPVSSLGHTVLVPALLGWHEKQSDPTFLAFVVALHLGTAAALLVFFWRDWLQIAAAVLHSIAAWRLSDDPNEHLGWLIVAGAVPAGILGALFKESLNSLLGAPWLAAIFLGLNGLVLLAGERLRRGAEVSLLQARATSTTDVAPPADTGLNRLGFGGAFAIGAAQAVALLPGFSRSGTSMVGGLYLRLPHIDAARFSFLLATPLILAAGLVSVGDLFAKDARIGPGLGVTGMIISGITAYLAVRFLMRYFQSERLDPFGYYCIAASVGSLTVLAVRAAN